MRAVLFDGEIKYVEDYPLPMAHPGEAFVRVSLAGICNTDQEIARGYMGFKGVLGHEFVGVVEDAESRSLIGARVVGEINCACGACAYCRRGEGAHCPTRTVLGILGRDGAFADYLRLPVVNLHPVPDSISDQEAVFVEPLAACLQIAQQVHLRPTDRVVVLGDGKLGFLAALVLASISSKLLAVGKHPSKLALLKSQGIETRLAGEVDDRLADVVVDCTGSPTGLELAIRLVRPRGTIVLKSTVAGSSSLNLSSLVIDEITVVGSRCGPFEPAIQALQTRRVTVLPLISDTFSLDQAPMAFQRAARTEALKILFQIS